MGKGITRERTGYMLQELFKVLISNPDGIQARNAIDTLVGKIDLTEHEKGEYKSGGRRFDKILRFATVDAVKAGWMTKTKGIWSITEIGEEALKNFPNSEHFYQEATRLYRQWRQAQPDREVEVIADSTQEHEATITFEEADEQAWKEISDYLESIDPYRLQDLVAALLEAMGYYVSWISPPGKDAGLDIVAHTDPLGTKPPRIKVQVKRRKDNVGVEELRAFLALINEDDVGIYVTTGNYSKEASVLARQQERRRITLIDQIRLVELWIEYYAKLPDEKKKALPLKPIYFLAPND